MFRSYPDGAVQTVKTAANFYKVLASGMRDGFNVATQDAHKLVAQGQMQRRLSLIQAGKQRMQLIADARPKPDLKVEDVGSYDTWLDKDRMREVMARFKENYLLDPRHQPRVITLSDSSEYYAPLTHKDGVLYNSLYDQKTMATKMQKHIAGGSRPGDLNPYPDKAAFFRNNHDILRALREGRARVLPDGVRADGIGITTNGINALTLRPDGRLMGGWQRLQQQAYPVAELPKAVVDPDAWLKKLPAYKFH